MNCPHHCHIFKAQPRSYRQLPLRLFEFGTVYRHEQTGELNGMLRVRGLTQDDAHIFCTADQVEHEFRATIELTKFVLESVGLNDYRVQLSLRDPKSDKYVGSEDNWDRAEGALRGVLEDSGLQLQRTAWRSGVLRAQSRLHGARLHRPFVAIGDGPAGLQPARTFQTGVHRGRQSGPSAGDDPPRAVRFAGTVRGDVDRALCRRVSAVAGPRTNSGAAACRKRRPTTRSPSPSS